jgi:predicted AAA+ superfamily ATPase
MDRGINSHIRTDLEHKIVLLTGPRQSGKTTIAKSLFTSFDYLNMDNSMHMQHAINKYWDRGKQLLILDEFHKFKNWKRFIKGVYDTEGLTPKILITGSAKLDTYNKVGDSLAGRYFKYRLYPIDIQEACVYWENDPKAAFNRIMTCSGFPEPFLNGNTGYYKRWLKTHTEIILKQDLIDLTAVRSIKAIELLYHLLKNRVSSNINYANLAGDIQCDPSSIKQWIDILENMYMVFKITPYHKNIARSLLKEPKIYCYDFASIMDEGAKLENLVALSILKRLHFLEDIEGANAVLHYCRTKDGKEIDFLVKIESTTYLIEVKTSESKISQNFAYFAKFCENVKCIQLVKNLDREYTTMQGYEVRALIPWLAEIDKNLI